MNTSNLGKKLLPRRNCTINSVDNELGYQRICPKHMHIRQWLYYDMFINSYFLSEERCEWNIQHSVADIMISHSPEDPLCMDVVAFFDSDIKA